MHRDSRAAALVVLIAAACGDAGPSFELQFSDRALIEEAAKLSFYFYENGQKCTPLRTEMPRPRALLGPFELTLGPEAAEGVTYTTTEVPAGTYVVLVDAVTATGTIAGSGCAEGQQIFDQQRSSITLALSRNP